MTLTIGSLFSGYGGLDAGVQQVIPSRVIWHSDIKPAAGKLLDHWHPDIPNLGDITAINWASVPAPDILTGGFPCTDISAAGQQAGLIRYGDGKTRSGLWAEMCRAIYDLQPALVVAENVRAITSVKADSDVEPCPWCLGDDDVEPHMRALGAVLADLADIGFDAAWYGLRASEIGAPHERFRIFIMAWPSVADPADIGYERGRGAWDGWGGPADGDLADALTPGGGRASLDDGTGGEGARGSGQRVTGGSAGLRAATDAARTRCEGHGSVASGSKLIDADRDQHPIADTNGDALRLESVGVGGGSGSAVPEHPIQWGIYGPAVQRWATVLGRPAPAPTETGPSGGQRLSPLLTEWMMGLPLGHITDVPGLSRNDMLSLAGDGVVPQQAAAALRYLLAATEKVRAA